MKNETKKWRVGDRLYNKQDSIFNKTQIIKTIKIVTDITTVKFDSGLWLHSLYNETIARLSPVNGVSYRRVHEA